MSRRRHPDYLGLAILNAIGVLVALFAWNVARADPLALRIVNNDPEQTVDAARVCMDDLCREVPVSCVPGATCPLPLLPYPLGCYDLRSQVRAGGEWSDPSEVLRNLAFSGPLCHDADGSGRVTTSDFTSFLAAFRLF